MGKFGRCGGLTILLEKRALGVLHIREADCNATHLSFDLDIKQREGAEGALTPAVARGVKGGERGGVLGGNRDAFVVRPPLLPLRIAVVDVV